MSNVKTPTSSMQYNTPAGAVVYLITHKTTKSTKPAILMDERVYILKQVKALRNLTANEQSADKIHI